MSKEWIAIQSLGHCCGYDSMNKTAIVCEGVEDCKRVLQETLTGVTSTAAVCCVLFFVLFVFLTVSSCQQMMVDQAFPLVLFLLSTIDEGCNIHLVQSRGLYA